MHQEAAGPFNLEQIKIFFNLNKMVNGKKKKVVLLETFTTMKHLQAYCCRISICPMVYTENGFVKKNLTGKKN